MARDWLRLSAKSIKATYIRECVAEAYNIDPGWINSFARNKSYTWPRQVAHYLTRKMLKKSLPEIGRIYDRDHTTVLHSVSRVETAIGKSASLKASVEALEMAIIMSARQ